jgi:boron transporter
LERLGDDAPFYLSVVAALLVFMCAYLSSVVGTSGLFQHWIRVFLKDYGTPLTVIFFTGFVHIGRMDKVHLEVLPTSSAFMPTSGRSWLVNFWDLSVGEVFMALPFAILLTILFWFDHNGKSPAMKKSRNTLLFGDADLCPLVSSLIAQGSEFPLRKPPGFHWDIFLLGITTGVAGILGLPFPNGLIPQAPFHTQSLCVTKPVKELDEKGEDKGGYRFEATHVVEQRVSNLTQGLLTLGTMTGPLLVVLHLVPHGVLAGLFFVMGIQALEANGITNKLLFLARDKAFTPATTELKRIKRRSAIWIFVGIELFGFAATFAITQTVAAIGFPVFIFALIPVRALLLPKILRPEELAVLDAPTASKFTMEGIGGTWGDREDHDEHTDERAGNQGRAEFTSDSNSLRYRGSDYHENILVNPEVPRKSQGGITDLERTHSSHSTATKR